MTLLTKILYYYWRSFISIILIFTIVGISFIYSTQTVENIKIQSDQELNLQWRTDYDLLVSPSKKFTKEDDIKKDLVRRSDMGNVRGGITREQYEKIKNLSEVEVAAPLTFLGYMKAGDISSEIRPQEEGIYITTTETEVFDGIRYRKVPEGNSELSPIEIIHINPSFDYSKNINEYGEIYSRLGWARINSLIIPILFRMDYYWSIIAVDPEEEKKLLNLDLAIVEGNFFDDNNILLQQYGYPLIPMLLQKKAYDLKRTLKVWKIDDQELIKYASDPLQYKEELLSYENPNKLKQLPKEMLLELEFNPYSEDLLFYIGRVNIENGELIKVPSTSIQTHTRVYNLGEITHTNVGEWEGSPLYHAVPLKTHGEQINYRALDSTIEEKGFIYDIYGLFDPSLLENPYTTNKEPRSPDFYNPDPVYITHDTKGHPYGKQIKYHNPPNKEGYTTGGVDALTSLEAAEYFLGDEPISVIRVVVAGAGERSKESIEKVERVAEQIRKETGLHVDVMLGAADHKVQVLLDDFEGVPGYGYLLEGWSQAGASFAIEDRVNSTNLLLSGYILLMGLIGLSLVYRNYVDVRRKDILVQYTFGWKKSAILKQLLMEGLLVLLLVGFILLLGKLAIGGSWTWIQFGIASGILGFIAFLSVVFMYIVPLMKGLDHKTNLRTSGQVILPVLTSSPNLTLWGYLGHTLIRYGMRTLLKLLILVSTMVYLFLFLITKASSSSFLMLTFLGEDINLVLEPLQWVLFGLGLVLSIGSYLALQMNQMEKRTQEIQLYQAWGWTVRRWLSLYVMEELVISTIAILLGLGIGFGLLSALATADVVTPMATMLLILSTALFTLTILFFTLGTRSKRNRLREFN